MKEKPGARKRSEMKKLLSGCLGLVALSKAGP
jgi:hypothetical protein